MFCHKENNNAMYLFAGIGVGVVAGAVAGLLLAPKSGDEMREDISEKFREFKDKAESTKDNALDKFDELKDKAEKARDNVSDKMKDIKDKVDKKH